jgi:Tfp pilus assembly protein PilF
MTIEAAQRALADQHYSDAAALFEAALALTPDDADSWYNLGVARRMQLDAAGALSAYDHALAANVAEPEAVHLNKAAIYSDVLHDVAAARASLGVALAVNPGFWLAWLNLGQLEEDAGNAAAARTAYQSALLQRPGLGQALSRLAALDGFEGQPQAALDRLAAAETDAVNPTDLFEMDYAAAAALDALGQYDAAFARAAQANDWQRRLSGLRYRPADQARQISALIELFPVELFPVESPAVTDHQPDPIFICGLFRSGSTLLETQLNRRFGITMGGELAFTPWFVIQNGSGLTPDGREAFIAAYASGYTDFCRTVLGPVSRFTDKRMDNFLYLGLIKRAFPKARIIHTVRNPIDNFLSMYFLPFADNLTYTNDFDDMHDFYRQYRRIMAHWQQCFGDDIITVRYDDLVAQPDAVLADLATRLDLAPAISMRDAGSEQIIRTASVWHVRQPVHRRSSGRWRHYADYIGELAAELQAEFPEFN